MDSCFNYFTGKLQYIGKYCEKSMCPNIYGNNCIINSTDKNLELCNMWKTLSHINKLTSHISVLFCLVQNTTQYFSVLQRPCKKKDFAGKTSKYNLFSNAFSAQLSKHISNIQYY